MWGDAAYGEAAYGEAAGDDISSNASAIIAFVAEGVGASIVGVVAEADFGFSASGFAGRSLTKVKIISTVPRGNSGKTKLSHTGLN
jgi:hypothetical protein